MFRSHLGSRFQSREHQPRSTTIMDEHCHRWLHSVLLSHEVIVCCTMSSDMACLNKGLRMKSSVTKTALVEAKWVESPRKDVRALWYPWFASLLWSCCMPSKLLFCFTGTLVSMRVRNRMLYCKRSFCPHQSARGSEQLSVHLDNNRWFVALFDSASWMSSSNESRNSESAKN